MIKSNRYNTKVLYTLFILAITLVTFTTSKVHIKLKQKFIPLNFNRTTPNDTEQSHFFDDNLVNHIEGRPIPITNLLTGVSATGCKDAATTNFLAGVSRMLWQESFWEWPPQALEIMHLQGRHRR